MQKACSILPNRVWIRPQAADPFLNKLRLSVQDGGHWLTRKADMDRAARLTVISSMTVEVYPDKFIMKWQRSESDDGSIRRGNSQRGYWGEKR